MELNAMTKNKKKPLFSKKGNPKDYNYLSNQFISLAIVAALFLLMIIFIK